MPSPITVQSPKDNPPPPVGTAAARGGRTASPIPDEDHPQKALLEHYHRPPTSSSDSTTTTVATLVAAMQKVKDKVTVVGPLRRALRQATPLQLYHIQQIRPSLLHECCRVSSLPNFLLLVLEFGFDVSVNYGDLGMPFHVACAHGKADIVEYLLTMDPAETGAVQPTRHSRRTPLHFAAAEGHLNVVKQLVFPSASSQLLQGRRAQVAASSSCSTAGMRNGKGDPQAEVATLTPPSPFILQGTDENNTCPSSSLPFGTATAGTQPSTAASTATSVRGEEPCREGDEQQQQQLKENVDDEKEVEEERTFSFVVEIDAIDIKGRTPLCVALDNKHLEVAEYLIKCGASLSVVTSDLRMPWMGAVDCASTKLLKATLLVRRRDSARDERGEGEGGIDPAAAKKIYSSPLRYATSNKNLDDCATLLIVRCMVEELGEDPNEKTVTQLTPYHLAQKRGKIQTAEYLSARTHLKPDPPPTPSDVYLFLKR